MILGKLLISIVLANFEPGAQNVNHQFELKDGKWKEACFESSPGMRIEYEFAADQTLNFNIHWHEGKNVTNSVDHKNLKSLKGAFEPSIKQTYCLSWFADKSKTIKAQYKYSHVKKKN